MCVIISSFGIIGIQHNFDLKHIVNTLFLILNMINIKDAIETTKQHRIFKNINDILI